MAAARQPHQRAAAAERPSLASLSSCITCTLCRGYLIDAVTLVKCLHSFCKACILKRLEKDSTCPVCDLRISTMKLDLHLKKDDALQNIVYKAVPGLYQREMKRRRDFYDSCSKGDKTTLTPEERGELDDSSKGRVIFSPDEAISLSLEYKKSHDQSSKGEKCKTEKRDPSFKEPPKRYLNCPAAVTIALLQKFLRMKYSIGARSRIDIYYMNEVLWSKYTLMDVAYIYSWRRDAPLELSFWIWEPAAKGTGRPQTEPSVGGNLGSPRTNPFSRETCDLQKSSEYLKDGVTGTDHDDRCSGGDVVKSEASEGPENAFTSLIDKSGTSSKTTHEQPVQSTTTGTKCKPRTDDATPPVESDHRNPEKDAETGCRPDILQKSKGASTTGEEARAVSRTEAQLGGKSVGETAGLVADNSGCARTSGNFFRRTISSKSCPANKVAHPKDNSEVPITTTVADGGTLETSKMAEVDDGASKSAGTTTTAKEMPGNKEQKAVERPRTSADVSSTKNDGREPAELSGASVAQKSVPTVSSPMVNGVDEDIFKTWRSTSTEKHLVGTVEKKMSGSVVPNDSKRVASTEPVKTCVSRAADKAEAKLNALRAAAASVKTRVDAVDAKETRSCDSSGLLPVVLAVDKGDGEATDKEEKSSRISQVAADDSTNDAHKNSKSAVKNNLDQAQEEAGESRRSSVNAVVTSTVTARAATDITRESEEGGRPSLPSQNSKQPVEAVTSTTEPAKTPTDVSLPTYLTLSRSHPSLFHAAPRKRGRPKLATVNSLNEEVERAHMLAKQAVALEKQTKRTIPVITSLRIKPIPPPPERAEEKSLTKSDLEDGRRKSKRRRTEQPSKETPDSSVQSPRNVATPEKITIRVTRDETCTLKVEKLQRVTEGLHDSGFCEDAAEKSPPSDSKVPERSEKKTLHPTKQPPESTKKTSEEVFSRKELTSTKNEKTKEKPPIIIKVAPPKTEAAAKAGEPRKESRKCKRKSVEEWVDEQNRWIHGEKQTVKSVAEGPDAIGRLGNLAKGPPADTHKGTTRRGRKRANPVKIEKLESRIESQRVSVSPAAPPPAVSSTVPSKVPERAESKERMRHEGEGSPPNTRPAAELIIPRYVPNPATSIPLTITHARNKRLKEAVAPKTSVSPPASTSKPTVERDDSEKSKFFKEALNLSMKQAPKRQDVPSPQKSKKPSQTTRVTEAFSKVNDIRQNPRNATFTTNSTHRVDSTHDRGHPAKEQGRSRLMGKTLFSRTSKSHEGKRYPSSTAEVQEDAEGNAKTKSASTGIVTREEAEILPKLSDTGVFRLEFLGDGPSTAQGGSETNCVPIESRSDVAESIKNIARIRKTMLESRQQSAAATTSTTRAESAKEEAAAKGTMAKDIGSVLTAEKESNTKSVDPQTSPVAERVTRDGTRSPLPPRLEKRKTPETPPPKEIRPSVSANPLRRGSKSGDSASSRTREPWARNGPPESSMPVGKRFAASVMRACKSASPPAFFHEEARSAHRQSTTPSPKHHFARSPADSRETPPANTYKWMEKHSEKSKSLGTSCGVSQSSTEISRRSREVTSHQNPVSKHSPATDVTKTSVVSQIELSDRTADVVRVKTERDLPQNVEDGTSERQVAETQASEHMYRTTVAEIDLFTALSIIETIKGRATVHDIVEDYVAHLGKFFGALETSDRQTRRLVEQAFLPKRPVLLRLVGLLKKLTLDLSSSQVSQVFALEVLIERFLSRYADDDALSKTEGRGTSEGGRVGKSVTPVPVEPIYTAEDLAEPPLTPMRTTASGQRRHLGGRRVARAARSRLWKRRLEQVLKLEEPLWLLPLIPGPRNAPHATAFPKPPAGALLRVEESASLSPRLGASVGLRPVKPFRPTTHFVAHVQVNSFLHLVNPTTNGQRPFVVQKTRLAEMAEARSKSPVHGRLCLPKSSQFERTFLVALRELLGSSEGCLATSGKIRLETDASSLVITAPDTKNKLVLSAEVGRSLLTGLLTRMGWRGDRCQDWESLFGVLTKQTHRNCLRAVEAGRRAEGRSATAAFLAKEASGNEICPSSASPRAFDAGTAGVSASGGVAKTTKRCRTSTSNDVAIRLKKMRISAFGSRALFRKKLATAGKRVAYLRSNQVQPGGRGRFSEATAPNAAEVSRCPTSDGLQNDRGAPVRDGASSAGGWSQNASHGPPKRPARDAVTSRPSKRGRKSLHIPVIKGETAAPPSPCPSVVPRVRTTLLRRQDPAERKRRRTTEDDVERKPKPVASR